MTIDTLYVFNTQQLLIGKIEKKLDGYEFKYAKSTLSNPNAIALNPIHLPLHDKVFFAPFSSREQSFSGVQSAFGDALPGAWGQAVLNAQANRKLMPLELLLENQLDRIGHLIFSQTLTFPDLSQSRIQEPFQWQQVLAAKEQFEKTKQFSPAFSELFKQGASQGGVRPKLTIIKDHQLYLTKLPSIQDTENKAQIEFGTLALARSVGIHTAESLLLNVSPNQDIFLTKRFDYLENDKCPFLSMKSILAVDHNQDASYGNFALELKRLNGGKDSTEIFKRMLFNAMVSNHDDHYLNHGVIWKGGEWRLSPAYDVVAGEGNRRSLVTNAGKFGCETSVENLLSEVEKFSLSTKEAEHLFDKMKTTIKKHWKNIFSQNGVDEDVIRSISWAILHDYP